MPASADHSKVQEPSWERLADDVAYRHCRIELSGLIADHLEAADRVVPACPEWTVRDVIAHVVGGCVWAVQAREGLDVDGPPDLDGVDVDRLLDDWRQAGDRLDALLAGGADPMHPMMALDLFAHELDIRHVLARPAPKDHPVYPGALDSAVAGFSREVRSRQLPALRIVSPGAQWVAGAGTPEVTLEGDRHDLFRTLTGRRTMRQIASLSWSASPDPWLPAFEWGLFTPPDRRTEDVVGAR
jgi:uncharacterized protein (TIGR03083 family)